MQHLTETALTPMDICGVPQNPMYERLSKVMGPEDQAYLNALKKKHDDAELAVDLDPSSKKKEALRNAFHEYNRAIWALAEKYPQAEPVGSREQVNVKPPRLANIPIIVANSTALGLRSLMADARYAAIGIAMQENDITEMDAKLRKYSPRLRKADPLMREACVLTPDHTVEDYWRLIQRYEDNDAIVVEGDTDHFDRNGKWIGMVGPDEIRKAQAKSTAIRKILKPKEDTLTAPVGTDTRGALNLMDKHGKNFLPFVDNGHVVGVTNLKSVGYHLQFPQNVDTERGGLAFMVALRNEWKKNMDVIRKWIEERLVGKGFKFDRAHLDLGTKPYKFIAALRKLIDELDPTLELLAGNMATGDAALRAVDAGATGVVVGIGPSPVCITRTVSGHGVPQITAMREVAQKLDKYGHKNILKVADGGTLDTPTHVVDVIREGADFAMGSTHPAKTRESSEPINNFDDAKKRTVWVGGNASRAAQVGHKKVSESETDAQIYRRTQGPRKEGESREVPTHSEFETMREFFSWEMDGLTSGVTFAGADNNAELHEYGKTMFQTTAGAKEGQARI